MDIKDFIASRMNFRGKEMNEETLMEMKPDHFGPGMLVENAYNLVLNDMKNKKPLYAIDETIVIFAHIFGTNGCSKDLDLALSMSKYLHKRVMSKIPSKDDKDEYSFWLQEYAITNALFGLIYALQKEYVKSMYHFIVSLKTNRINLSVPFCDFISYVLNKVTTLDAEDYKGQGAGFSADNYAGNKSGDLMFPPFAEDFIGELEGNDKEVILLKKGRMRLYGSITRTGSILSRGKNIDMYETYLVDKDYKLFKVKFYINNYCERLGNEYILPAGFSLIWDSKFKEIK